MNKLNKMMAAAVSLLAAMMITGCTTPMPQELAGGSPEAWEAISNGAPVRVAVYVGPGARGVGMFRWMQITDQAQELSVRYVDGTEIRNGALKFTDLLVMPGGKSRTEADRLGEKGQLEIRNFIERGGSYIGSCAGAFLLMRGEGPLTDDPTGRRRRILGIAPFKHRNGDYGGEAMLQVVYSKEAETLCGIKAGRREERFNGGPVMDPSEPVPGADFRVMARFDSNLHSDTKNPDEPGRPLMAGGASAVAGTFGRGRVWLFAGHPEYYPSTWSSVSGAFKFTTGRNIVFSAPQRRRGQLAVGWWCKPGPGVVGANLARALVRDRYFDVVPYSNEEVLRTDLRHVDVMVVPDSPDIKVVASLDSKNDVMQAFTRFMQRGGRIVTWGDAGKLFKLPTRTPVASLYVAGGRDQLHAAHNALDALRAIRDVPPPAPRKGPPPKVAKPVRAAVYYDEGVGGCAAIRWIKMLSLSPECECTPVSAADVRNGALEKADIYIAPGGMSTTQSKLLQKKGRNNIIEFVRKGGGYFGTCAGLYLALSDNTTNKWHLGLLPYISQTCPYRGGAELNIQFTDKAGLFGMRPGENRTVRYHGGPVLLPSNPVPGVKKMHEIALYDCDGVYSFNTNAVPVMANTPAVVAAEFGKGRVAGTSPHPESYTHTQDIIRGGLKYITNGRTIEADYPQRTRGNLSVCFHASALHKDGAMLVQQLFREPSIDLRAVATETINQGELEHCDVLVLAHPGKKRFTRRICDFARNGGVIVAFGTEKELGNVPKDLPNVVKCASADSARKAILGYAADDVRTTD